MTSSNHLFPFSLPRQIESRILQYLDLISLSACRLVNTRWLAAVDGLHDLWLALNHRLGIRDACEIGRERLRIGKLLGNCWVTCTFCPITDGKDCLESGLRLSSLRFEIIRRKRAFCVQAFSPRSAAFVSWRIQLQDANLLLLDLFVSPSALDWNCMAMVDFKSGRGHQRASKPISEALLAVVPLHKSPNGCATALALVPWCDALSCAIHRCGCGCNQTDLLLIMTTETVKQYVLPGVADPVDRSAATMPPTLGELKASRRIPKLAADPQDTYYIELARGRVAVVPRWFPLTMQCVRSAEGRARCLVYLMQNSRPRSFRIDVIRLTCNGGMDYVTGEPLDIRPSSILQCWDTDDQPIFLFSTPTFSILKRFSLTETDSIAIESQVYQILSSDSMYFAVSVAVGRMFWYRMLESNKESNWELLLVIYRIGYPEILTIVCLENVVPLGCFRTIDFNLFWKWILPCSWIDDGFEPDSAEGTPLLAINCCDGAHLLVTWHFKESDELTMARSKSIRVLSRDRLIREWSMHGDVPVTDLDN